MLRNENILKVDYRIDGEVLYRYHTKVVERIVPWGREAGAWRLIADTWELFAPEIDVSSLEQTAWQPGTSRLPSWRRYVAACRFLIEHWPEEARDTVRRFPSEHWRLLEFVNTGGAPALELLQSNPALGYLAARAGAASQTGLRRRSLAALFGFPETEHTVRLLRKVPTAWISNEFLGQLRAVTTQEPDADAVITYLGRINPVALEVARDPELRARVAPDCIARLSSIPASLSHCDLIGRMRDLLESARGAAFPPPRIGRLADLDRPSCTERVEMPPVLRRPAALRGEALALPTATPARALPNPPVCAEPLPASPPARRRNPSAFPEPPLSDLAVPGIRIQAIGSRRELIAESDTMHHCAGRDPSYARRVAEGRLYFYRMVEPERLTIAIRPAGNGWIVETVRGVCNRQPSEHSTWLIWNWVQGSRAPSVVTRCADPTPPARPVPVVLRQATPVHQRPFTAANQLSFEFGLRE